MRKRHDAGFSLAALIFFATAASIALAAAVPVYKMQLQRQQEAELIFRGEEYMRAIQKYQRKFGIYPPSVEALLQTNGLRFVRRQYKDPITDKPFRLIYINPDGSLTGSTLYTQRISNTPLFGGNLQMFGQQPQQQIQRPQPQQQPQGGPGQRGAQGRQGQPQSPPTSGGFAPASPQSGQPSAFGSPNANPTFGTAGIIGVASDSVETSVMVYNNRQKYNEWEFIAILGQPGMGGAAGQQPGAFPAGGGVQPSPQGQPQTPFGQVPGQQPFGQQPGQPFPQQPFGFGQTPQSGQPQQPIKKQ